MNMMASASRSVKIALAHSVFDIFLVHEAAILKNQDNNVSFFLMWPSWERTNTPLKQIDALTTFLLHHIEHEQDPEVKAIFCKGTCKLVLPGMITDVNVCLWIFSNALTILLFTKGCEKPNQSVHISRNGWQSRTTTVPSLFLANIQPLVSPESEVHARGELFRTTLLSLVDQSTCVEDFHSCLSGYLPR